MHCPKNNKSESDARRGSKKRYSYHNSINYNNYNGGYSQRTKNKDKGVSYAKVYLA